MGGGAGEGGRGAALATCAGVGDGVAFGGVIFLVFASCAEMRAAAAAARAAGFAFFGGGDGPALTSTARKSLSFSLELFGILGSCDFAALEARPFTPLPPASAISSSGLRFDICSWRLSPQSLVLQFKHQNQKNIVGLNLRANSEQRTSWCHLGRNGRGQMNLFP